MSAAPPSVYYWVIRINVRVDPDVFLEEAVSTLLELHGPAPDDAGERIASGDVLFVVSPPNRIHYWARVATVTAVQSGEAYTLDPVGRAPGKDGYFEWLQIGRAVSFRDARLSVWDGRGKDVPDAPRFSGSARLYRIGLEQAQTMANVIRQMKDFRPSPPPPFYPNEPPITSKSGFEGKDKDKPPSGDMPMGNPAELAGYIHDGSDREVKNQLGPELDGEIRAMARLIAARETRPPLAIGLFGPWGMGKSFFMNKVHEEVKRISPEPKLAFRANQGYCRGTVQVEFNAWHYAESNMWAGLVVHLFDELEKALPEHKSDADSVGDARKAILEQMETFDNRWQVVAERLEKINTRMEELQKIRKPHEEEEKTLSGKLQSFPKYGQIIKDALVMEAKADAELEKVAGQLGIGKLENAWDQLDLLVADSRKLTSRSRILLASLLDRQDEKGVLTRLAILLGIVLGVALAWRWLGWLIDKKLDGAEWSGLVAQVTAVVGTVTFWLQKTMIGAGAALDRLEALHARVQEQSKQKWSEQLNNKQEIENKLEQVRAQAEGCRLELAEIEQEQQGCREQLLELSDMRRVSRFIRERADSREYHQHLGIMDSIRRDFEMLAAALGRQPEDDPQEKKWRLERIVLYIDDLDRCPREQVMELLEAVHLMLAIPLFIVVVGVDPKWIRSALRNRYGDQLSGQDRAPDPDLFLEKIFQVPFWLREMDEDGYRMMVQALAAADGLGTGSRDDSGKPALTGAGKGGNEDQKELETPAGAATEQPQAVEIIATPVDVAATAAAEEAKRVAEAAANPQPIKITEKETVFMGHLWPLLANTPRGVKRFVNTYRLIKHRYAPGSTTFETDDYKTVQLLLALWIGEPRLTPFFLGFLWAFHPETSLQSIRPIAKQGNKDKLDSFIDAIRQQSATGPAATLTREKMGELIAKVIRVADQDPPPLRCEKLADWQPRVQRFIFSPHPLVNSGSMVRSGHGLPVG